MKKKAKWIFWSGWAGNHDKRIDDAKCSNCGYLHPIVYGIEKLEIFCPSCGKEMLIDKEEK